MSETLTSSPNLEMTNLSNPPEAKQRLEIAVVIPTYDERENVAPLLQGIEQALRGIEWEVIFVDDSSPDGTAEHIRAIAAQDRRVRVIERIGRRGLSSACIEGMLSTAAPYIAIMDGDLQHDETLLPFMLESARTQQLDLAIASRNVEGGSMGDFAPQRVWLSNLGKRISRAVCKCEVSDPMSGFFLVERSFFRQIAPSLTGKGFKLLVDLLASSPRRPKIVEMPYRFRNREHGLSKLDTNVELEYLFLVVDKMIGRYVPTRFVLFIMVGSLGVFVHLGCLAFFYKFVKTAFINAQALATLLAMTFNFVLNNMVTFRDYQLRGWGFIRGLITFYVACSLGALMNVGFAQFLNRSGLPWYLAGLAGIAVTSVWNYGANTVLTWRRTRPAARAIG